MRLFPSRRVHCSNVFLLAFAWLALVPRAESNVQHLSKHSHSGRHRFITGLHGTFEEARIRKKRSIHLRDEPPRQPQRVSGSSEVHLPFLSDFSATCWTSTWHDGEPRLLVGTEEGHLLLFQLGPRGNGKLIALVQGEDVAIKARAFSHDGEEWFAVLQRGSSNNTWVRFYQRIGRDLERKQTIRFEADANFDMETVKGVHYMAVVTGKRYSDMANLHLYHWTRTQFDLIATRAVHAARHVACWQMDGTLYLVVAQEFGHDRRYSVGSPVFMFSTTDDGGLVLQDMIATTGPTKVAHFSVSGSHYVVFTGLHKAEIYWWSSSQFLLWQTFERTERATELSVLQLADGEIVISVVIEDKALLFTVDESGHYFESYTLNFFGFHLASLHFMFSGTEYYALAVFKQVGYEKKKPSVRKLGFEPFVGPTRRSVSPLQACLQEFADTLDKRQFEIDATYQDLERVWTKGRNQTIQTEVVITGEATTSEMSVLKEILVVTERKILPNSSFAEVEGDVFQLTAMHQDIKESLQKSVLKTARQDIHGAKVFNTILIPSLNMVTAADVPINGVPISKISRLAVKKEGNYTFHNPIDVQNVFSDTITTGLMNGIDSQDLLLRKGEQLITGSLKFSDVVAEDVIAGSINSISSDDLVTIHSDQVLKDLKRVPNLAANTVDISGEVNGNKLNTLVERIIYLNEDSDIEAKHIFNAPFVINGDLFVKTNVNKEISVLHLVKDTVKKETEELLLGPFTMASPTAVTHDIIAKGLVNGIRMSDLLTLHTDQSVDGDIYFKDLLKVERDLIVDFINEIDLDKTALLKTTDPQFVQGFKTFHQAMVADFVQMTEYVTLDGVDPSMLIQEIVNHEKGVVNAGNVAFHNVVVRGNLSVTEGVNGHQVSDLSEVVWLKSEPQVISVPVKITQITSRHDMETKKVNNLTVDEDIVRVYGDEDIISFKIFEHEAEVDETVDATPGAMINGLDVVSVTNEMDNYVEKGVIKGEKSIEIFEIYGDIDVEYVNGLNIHNMVQSDSHQVIHGEQKFLSELTVIADDLKSNIVKFSNFNGVELHSFTNAVPSKNLTYALRNKAIPFVKPDHVVFHDGSYLNNLQFPGMFQRVATLDSSKVITGNNVFLKPLHLKSTFINTLNGKEAQDFGSNVVLLDHADSVIAHKTFTGKTIAENLVVEGFLNTVNFNHFKDSVFLKSLDNTISQPMTFVGQTYMSELISSSKIDGLDWDDILFTIHNENLDKLSLPAGSSFYTNLIVSGLLNECNLTDFTRRALYASNANQQVQEKVTVKNIEILGNVNFLSEVNNIPFDKIRGSLISIDGPQIITADISLCCDFSIRNFDLQQVNDIDIAHIIQDSVKHSISEVIKGRKYFDHVTADGITAGESLVEILNELDLNRLYETMVWKVGDQDITGDTVLDTVGAHSVTVGYLNGIRLPHDVVLSGTSDRIAGPTFFMSEVVAASHVDVGGRIDGVAVTSLLEDRVTLTGDEALRSSLVFNAPVAVLGNLNVEGTVNNVVLEMIAKVHRTLPMEGFKIFVTDFRLVGSLNAASVNDHSLNELEKNILLRNRNENVNAVKVFNSSVMTNGLTSGHINGVSLPGLVSTFHSLNGDLLGTFRYYENLSNDLSQRVSNQLQSTSDTMSKFGYFVLFQELNIEPIARILIGINPSLDEISLVLWSEQRHCDALRRCCDASVSHLARVARSGRVTVDSAAVAGRYYPLRDPRPVPDNRNFVVWTNATQVQPKWCENRMEELYIASLMESGRMDVLHAVLNASTLSEIKTFRQGHLYAVAGFFYDKAHDEYSRAKVYVFDEAESVWSEYQILPSYGILSLDLVLYQKTGEILLALGTGAGTYSAVYKWNEMHYEFDWFQNLPSRYVPSTVWLRQGSRLLLAMANVEDWPTRYVDCVEYKSGGRIDIFEYKRSMTWIQSIPLPGVVSLVTFNVGDNTFLLAASRQHQSVFVYEWQGLSAFRLIQSIFVGEVNHINTYTIENRRYLSVALASGHSKILKLLLQGGPEIVTVSDQMAIEDQSDQPLPEKLVPGC